MQEPPSDAHSQYFQPQFHGRLQAIASKETQITVSDPKKLFMQIKEGERRKIIQEGETSTENKCPQLARFQSKVSWI